jgi:hypothetical protein
MSSTLRVKDLVSLRGGDQALVGMVVEVLEWGKFRVLWNKDWDTGRIFTYNNEELRLCS